MSDTPISRLVSKKQSIDMTANEKNLIFLQKKDHPDAYAKLYSDLQTYLSKIKNTASNIVNLVLSRDLLYIGLYPGSSQNVLGFFIVTDGKLEAILININALDIDYKTGEVGEVDNTIYAIYFQFIRAVVYIFQKDIERDSFLNDSIIEYLSFLFMKGMKLPMLNDKQVELFKFLTAIMFYKYYYKYNDALAIENSERVISKDYIDEFKKSLKNSNISKYSDIKDLIKLCSEYKLTFDPPNQIMYNLLISIKSIGFQTITSDIYNLIAIAIVSQYPCEYYQNAMVSRQSQSKIENSISQYFNKVQFGNF
jgi:hypothetical protein